MPEPVLATKDFTRTTLKPRHRPLVRALAEALFCPAGEATPERLDDFPDEVDRFISFASKTLRFGLVAMLEVLRFAPILLFYRFRLFEDLPLDERVVVLGKMDRSKVTVITLVLVAYKTLMSMLFFETPEQLAQIGYPGPERSRYKRGLPAVASDGAGGREGAVRAQ